MTPLDSDYTAPWRPASEVRATQTGIAITVDLSGDAFANTNVGCELASRALQQLVYTATAAASQTGTPAETVTVTVDGESADVWGVLQLGEPMKRAEATFTWAVRDAAGSVVGEGHTMGGTGSGGFGEFTFTAELTPGEYTVEVPTSDPSGGAEGRGAATDDKAFSVV